VMQS